MKNYFNFSKSQKVGVLIVLCIIFIQVIWLNSETRLNFVDPFVADDSEYLSIQNKYEERKSISKQKRSKKRLSKFNPNKISLTDWIEMGFSRKQAESIIKFRSRIGGFKSKEDIKKIYVISKKKYIEIEPYISIEKKNSVKSNLSSENSQVIKNVIQENNIKININKATFEELVKISGIGEYTANGILMYRNELGGFHSLDQLLQVNGVSEENFNKIKLNLKVSHQDVVMLNVNLLSIPQLKKHPYITWSIAEAITRKRLLMNLDNLEFLVVQELMSIEKLNSLLPYIKY